MPPDSTSFLLRNLVLQLDEPDAHLVLRICERYSLVPADILSLKIVRKGIDARKKPQIKFVHTVSFSVADSAGFRSRHGSDPDLSEECALPLPPLFSVTAGKRVVIAGTGPAGLFAALRLVDHGMAPLVLERGKPVAERVRDVGLFWNSGVLDGESNVQFGEGGAGTFSDGKLYTRVRDPNIGYVLQKLIAFGAPPEIAWLAKPHVGTDRLRSVVVNIRQFLEDRGAEIRFNARLTDLGSSGGRIGSVMVNDALEEQCDFLILAPGHSARDTYAMLHSRGIPMEAKPFAVGLRVEHPQELINRIQYALPRHPGLPPADYALAYNNSTTGRSAYSFCMCPGGVVIASASESGGVVTNGMSDHRRSSIWANSALVVNVRPEDFSSDSALAGIQFQRELEQAAFRAGGGNYRAPVQGLLHFMGKGRAPGPSCSYRPGAVEAELGEILPPYVTRTLREGLLEFDRKMRGFVTVEATLIGVESRTSAPVRLTRGGDFQSVGLEGLYPAGEGAGYAGGIMSAAIDGIRVADAILEKCR